MASTFPVFTDVTTTDAAHGVRPNSPGEIAKGTDLTFQK